MSQFSATVSTAPVWFAAASMGLYVSVEELIFRGILLELLRPAGAVWAIGISTVLFVMVQAFSMPGWRAAMFPMVGAAILGLVHGFLYWRVPVLLPLVVAHLTYFGGALGVMTRRDAVPRVA
jgi:membrane protease YdiL (CAAX protease family)